MLVVNALMEGESLKENQLLERQTEAENLSRTRASESPKSDEGQQSGEKQLVEDYYHDLMEEINNTMRNYSLFGKRNNKQE